MFHPYPLISDVLTNDLSQKKTVNHYFIIMSYRQLLYQIVFGTKNRESTISESYSDELYKYIWGVIKKHKCNLYRINGMENHLHIFSDLHPTICLSDYIKNIKVSSNLCMRESGRFPKFAGWQERYAAFTYSIKKRLQSSTTSRIKRNIISMKHFMTNSKDS